MLTPTKPFGFHATKTKMVKVGAQIYAMMIKLLENPVTRKEIAEETGLHYVTVLHYMRALHDKKAIHIVGYEIDSTGRENAPMFKLGPGKDKKRRRKPPSERAKAYRHNKKLRELTYITAGVRHETTQDK